MKNYKCTVKFSRVKTPDFCPTVFAADKGKAIEVAKIKAKQCGFNDPIKSVTAREMSQSD